MYRSISSAILIALAIILISLPVAYAEDPIKQMAQPREAYSFVISGGISLGNYEAGVNWAMMRILKHRNPGRTTALRSVVGASAGGINTLANAAFWCTDDGASNGVDDNIFKDVWLGVGIDELLPGTDGGYLDGDGLLSRVMIDKSRDTLKDYVKGGTFKDCRIPMAITLTKVVKQTVVEKDIVVSNNRYVVPLVFISDADGAHFENNRAIQRSPLMGNILYLPEHEGRVDINDVLMALKATSAFPVAFGTMKLDVCTPGGDCGSVEFLDGGVLDNVPLGTAVAISDLAGADAPVRFVFIDPDNTRTGIDEPVSSIFKGSLDGIDNSLLGQMKFLSGFYGAARDYELYSTLRYLDSVLNKDIDKMRLLKTDRFPLLTGNYMMAFGAFMDESFREYDYYAGVYDGVLNMSRLNCGAGDSKCLADTAMLYYAELGIEGSRKADYVFRYMASAEFSQSQNWGWIRNEDSTGFACYKSYQKAVGLCDNGKSSEVATCIKDHVEREVKGCPFGLGAIASSLYHRHDGRAKEPRFITFLSSVSRLHDLDETESETLRESLASKDWRNPLMRRALGRLKQKEGRSDGNLGPIFGIGGSYVQSQMERQRWLVLNRTSGTKWFVRALPYEWSVNMNTRAFQATWESRLRVADFPRWYNFDAVALNFRYGGGTEENVLLDYEGEEHWYLVAQPFITLEGWAVTVGFSPYAYTWMRDYESGGYAFYIGVLDDRLRFTYGEREVGRTRFKKDSFVTIGIADLPGFVEWLF